jgi:dUTP pyrophosphatase
MNEIMQATIRDPTVTKYYHSKTDTDGNSGFDLYLPATTNFPAGHTVMVNFGVAMKTNAASGFWLLPRSSLSKTPLRLANSVGLVDPNYRGSLIGAFHNTGPVDIEIPEGTRLLQVALPSLMPFRMHWVHHLDETERGSGGFGSTGGTFGEVNHIK